MSLYEYQKNLFIKLQLFYPFGIEPVLYVQVNINRLDEELSQWAPNCPLLVGLFCISGPLLYKPPS